MDNQEFLYDLFGDIEEPNRILIWRKRENSDGTSNKDSHWFPSPHDATLFATSSQCDGYDVYFGLGIAPHDYGPHNRCPANEVVAIPGFWLDLDIKGDNHADQNLPADDDAAMALLKEFPLDLSFVVRSGGGMHAYWKFVEPWLFDTIEERKRGGEATKAFVDTFRAAARQHGFKVDAVHDLARILRVPGTLNHKTDPPRKVELIVSSDKRYNPSEFEDYFISLTDSGQSLFDEPIVYTVGNLTLNPEAQPPNKIWAALENDDKFKKSWDKKRRDLVDQSASSYDMSIANMAVGYGWTDQEIVDTLIARHSKYNENDPKLNRLDYYKTTITKARQSARREMALENLEMLPEVTVSEAPDTDIRKRALENLRIRLELNITRVVKYNSDPPQYELFTQQGNIRLKSIDHLSSERLFKNAVAASSVAKMLPSMKKEWLTIVNAILAACEIADTGGESREQEAIESKLSEFLDVMSISQSPGEALSGRIPFIKNDHFFIFGNKFRAWCKTSLNEDMSNSDMGIKLRAHGAIPSQEWIVDPNRDGRGRPYFVWQLPDKYYKEYFKAYMQEGNS